ncbi:MAG: dipeptidase [Candidatus Acidiferrales bacterium]
MSRDFAWLVTGALLAAAGLLVAAVPADDIAERARKLHASAVVLDTHVDTPQRLLFEKFDLGKRDAEGHLDIPRMREGGLNAVFMSIWTPSQVNGPKGVKRALDLIDVVREQVQRHSQELALATTAEEVRRARAQGKIAVLMGMEGGHMIDDDLGLLRIYAALGVRYLTLTHGSNTNWADSSTDDPKHNGLTLFGRSVVRELNRLGVLVDISHVSDKTFYDALEASRAPLIASHSSCRALCNHKRNMTDDMIRALAKKGGVIQINYNTGFLSQEYAEAYRRIADEIKAKDSEADKLYGENMAPVIRANERIRREFTAAGKLPRVSWERIVAHIDHVVKLVGVDYVGLGSDFDGATMPEGMEDCSKLERITEALLRKGYSEADIRKILGENTLRVLEQAERVSREMQAGAK